MMGPYKLPDFRKAPKRCVLDLINYLSNLSYEMEAEMKLLSLNIGRAQPARDVIERSYLVHEGLKEITQHIDTLIAYLEDLN